MFGSLSKYIAIRFLAIHSFSFKIITGVVFNSSSLHAFLHFFNICHVSFFLFGFDFGFEMLLHLTKESIKP